MKHRDHTDKDLEGLEPLGTGVERALKSVLICLGQVGVQHALQTQRGCPDGSVQRMYMPGRAPLASFSILLALLDTFPVCSAVPLHILLWPQKRSPRRHQHGALHAIHLLVLASFNR